MSLTPFGFILLALAVPLMALSVWGPVFINVSLAWAGLVLVLGVLDSVITRRLARLEAEQ